MCPGPEDRGVAACGAGGQMPLTRLSLIQAGADEGGSPGPALDEFARRYRPPAYAFIRAMVRDETLAADLTQEFFTVKVLKNQLLGKFKPGKRFRHYFKAALRNHVKDYWRRRQLEGPGDGDEGDLLARLPANPRERPDAAFHLAWVRALLNDSLAAVRDECAARGESRSYEIFIQRHLGPGEKPPPWGEIAEQFQISEKAAQELARTVARRLRRAIRRQVGEEVDGRSRVDREIVDLLSSL